MGRALIFFWIPVSVGVLVGKALGGKVAHLGSIELRRIWLLLLAVGTQAALILPAPTLPEQGVDPLRYALPLTTGAICMWAALNRALPGMWVVLAGAACNLVVICANGGLMPTNADALLSAGKHASLELSREHPGIRLANSKDVLLAPEETQLWWLSDVIVSPPLPQRKVMSVGDLVIAAGLAYLAGRATYAPLSRRAGRHTVLRVPTVGTIPTSAPSPTAQENEHGAPVTAAQPRAEPSGGVGRVLA